MNIQENLCFSMLDTQKCNKFGDISIQILLISPSENFNLKMVNKCNATCCFSNYPGHDSATLFKLPEDKDLQLKWIKFLNRETTSSLKNIFLCEKHFEDKYLKKNEKRSRLILSMRPVPTIHSDSQKYYLRLSSQPTITATRKPPTSRVFQEDELEKFRARDKIEHFNQINESLLKDLEDGYSFKGADDHALFYKFELNDSGVPEITNCIRVDDDLRVKLFFKGSPIPLPTWFRKGRDTKLTSRSMFQNFSSYIAKETESQSDILEELQKFKFQKSPIYSAALLRYALSIRYTSLPAYNSLREKFKLPSIQLLHKISSGKIDPVASIKLLKNHGKICQDIILMFDEIYIQKCEEYSSGESIGADNDGKLYKGVVCFMIVGLKENIPFVIKSAPETEINSDWLKNQIINCIEVLQNEDFNIRGIVCDNHASNVSAYKKLLSMYASSETDLSISFNDMKIFLFFDTVHLMKNLRNNLLNRKRFIFPDFSSNALFDAVNVDGGEIAWGLFHKIYEKDQQLQANMRAAVKLTATVLHPGNAKQNVSLALAIFDPTTAAAVRKFFPEEKAAAEFLDLIYIWWTLSNSKTTKNSRHFLGNAAVANDGKPQFLREMADWLEKWETMKIINAEKFTISAQTSQALQRTLRCHAMLIEDLLSDGYNFVLTGRFQSDPIERRYGQYRQMSGGRFLVSAKDISTSEKILRIKSLLKENIDIDEAVKIPDDATEETRNFLSTVESFIRDSQSIQLSDDSRQVSDYIAGHIAYKAKSICEDCCYYQLVGPNDDTEKSYLSLVSRGGLVVPSESLSIVVAQGFALLDACSEIIRTSNLSSRKAGESILGSFLCEDEIMDCEQHNAKVSHLMSRIIINIFFNNQRKRTSESVVKDRVAAFKKLKRETR